MDVKEVEEPTLGGSHYGVDARVVVSRDDLCRLQSGRQRAPRRAAGQPTEHVTCEFGKGDTEKPTGCCTRCKTADG